MWVPLTAVRKYHTEGGSGLLLRFGPDVPAMLLDEHSRDGKAESGSGAILRAAILARLRKRAFQQRRRDRRTAVGNIDTIRVVRLGRFRRLPAIRRTV